MDDKTIKKERKKFLDNVKHMMKLGIKSATEVPENGIIVTNQVEDFDLDGNLVFKEPLNKSYPVDEYCSKCKSQVVMSGGMLLMLMKAREKKIKGIKIWCNRCAFKEFEQDSKQQGYFDKKEVVRMFGKNKKPVVKKEEFKLSKGQTKLYELILQAKGKVYIWKKKNSDKIRLLDPDEVFEIRG